ncbi:hypothetical protein AVEN_235266-1 [Araneus ventricosus]|uniref:Uncharacterized protein n=1 Tax=Araneus ventricosus TaxID=182803 RepID=A0A4Y2A403_ARAVE|nr:hypothetical protein AVEN_235266-1 [Araneus ventricosus]
MGIACRRKTPSLNMPERLRRMASRWPSAFFIFPKLKEHLSGTRFSSNCSMGREHLSGAGSMGRDVISTSRVKEVGPEFR